MQSVPEWTYTIGETYYFLAFTSKIFFWEIYFTVLSSVHSADGRRRHAVGVCDRETVCQALEQDF